MEYLKSLALVLGGLFGYSWLYAMTDYANTDIIGEREKLLIIFKEKFEGLEDSFFIGLENKSPKEQIDNDKLTALDIIDALPLETYRNIIKNTSRPQLVEKIEEIMTLIKKTYPEFSSYTNVNAFNNRRIFIEFVSNIGTETLCNFLQRCQLASLKPYSVFFWPDLTSQWYIPVIFNPQEVLEALRKNNCIKETYLTYQDREPLGKYITFKATDSEWEFNFIHAWESTVPFSGIRTRKQTIITKIFNPQTATLS